MIRMTEQEYAVCQERIRQSSLAPKQHKYRAQRVEIDGHKFASKKEGSRYRQLKMLEEVGKIQNLTLQPSFELAPAVTLDGKKKRSLTYVADFQYVENGLVVVEDVKSAFTSTLPVYRIKKHLMKAVLNIDVREV